MVSKQRLSVPFREHVAVTKGEYLKAWQRGDIVIEKQETRDWIIDMFRDIELYVDGLDKAVALSIGALHGTSSHRFDALVAEYREAADELPEGA